MTPNPSQPQLASIRFTVRVAVVTVTLVAAVALSVNAVQRHGTTTGVPVGVLVVDALALTALAANRRTVGQWCGLAALLVVFGMTAVGADAAFGPANTSSLIFVAAYLGICVLPRLSGLAWIATMVGLWLATAPAAALPVLIGSVSVNARWASLGQLVVSAVWLWVTWHREVERTRRRDAAAREAERSVVRSEVVQERIRAWRDRLVRTHETVLNDIRYVLDAPVVDRERLAHQLAAHDAARRATDRRSVTVGSLVADVAAGERIDDVDVGGAAAAALDDDRAEAVRAALTETVRNVRRHTDARTVVVVVVVDVERITFRVVHDGSTRRPGPARGIGRQIVLEESLTDIGGSVLESDGRIDLVVPILAGGTDPTVRTGSTVRTVLTDPTPVEPVDSGRVVLSTVLAGSAVGGVPFAVVLALTAGPVAWAMALANVVTAVIGARAALQRRTVTTPVVILVAVLGATVPIGAVALGSCDEVDVGMIVAVLTGFAATATVVWAVRARWWWTVIGWAVAMVVVVTALPGDCARQSSSAVVAGLAVPLFVAVIFVSLGHAAKAAERLRALERDAALAAARTEAVVDLDARLSDSVAEASALMNRIAGGAELDGETRMRLRCLDGLIRATIQFDPKTSGAMAQIGYSLVSKAAERGVPVRVLHLRDSGDTRAVDPEAVDDLRRLIAGDDGSAVVQVLSSPAEDVLLVTTTVAAAVGAGLGDHPERSFPGGSFSVDCDPSTALAVAMLRRNRQPGPDPDPTPPTPLFG